MTSVKEKIDEAEVRVNILKRSAIPEEEEFPNPIRRKVDDVLAAGSDASGAELAGPARPSGVTPALPLAEGASGRASAPERDARRPENSSWADVSDTTTEKSSTLGGEDTQSNASSPTKCIVQDLKNEEALRELFRNIEGQYVSWSTWTSATVKLT